MSSFTCSWGHMPSTGKGVAYWSVGLQMGLTHGIMTKLVSAGWGIRGIHAQPLEESLCTRCYGNPGRPL